ncbi:MAG: LysM peptidoglycan-binding domain-containing protein [Clostridiales bacterium]|nr:LysM peptidoglycan-binding domain-containing protein [Clostridiales bacterium]
MDSKFGASTEKGVRAFQTSVDIDVDGKFGSESFKALETFNAQSDPLTFTEYTVQRGDTLWKIAKKLLGKGGRYVEIKTLNDMTSDMIRTGKILKIPNK